jgi:hypothetical protein
MARTNTKLAEIKEDTVLVELGMEFFAIKDCCFDKLYHKGQPVPFAPGQLAPLPLVQLVRNPFESVEKQLGIESTSPAKVTDEEVTATTNSVEGESGQGNTTFMA